MSASYNNDQLRNSRLFDASSRLKTKFAECSIKRDCEPSVVEY